MLTTLFTATLGSLRTVSGLGLPGTLLGRQRSLADDCHRAGIGLARVRARIESSVRVVAGLGVAGVATAVVVALVAGRLSPGEAITGLGLLGIVVVSVTEVSQVLTVLLAALAGAARLTEVLGATPDPVRTRAADVRPPEPGQPLAAELGKARFSYPGQPGREVLRGVDLSIGPGQLVALAGRPGSGKTTVLRMLVRSGRGAGAAGRTEPPGHQPR